MSTSSNKGAVLVTGASRGLGRGIAVELAAAGFSVAINYVRNAAAADETAAECADRAAAAGWSDSEFAPIQGDVALREDRERIVSDAFERFGTIVGLVNNAGIAPRERVDIAEASEAVFEEVLTTNLQGPYFLTQAVVRRWLAEAATGSGGANPAGAGNAGEPRDANAAGRPGSAGGPGDANAAPSGSAGGPRGVVFVTSISAETVSLNRGEYCIAKAGLAMANKLWAARLAPHGIPVFEVRPGIMLTDMTSGVKAKYDALIEGGLVPQKRWGYPTDVGTAVRALLSGDFGFSTGSVIETGGGFHISRL